MEREMREERRCGKRFIVQKYGVRVSKIYSNPIFLNSNEYDGYFSLLFSLTLSDGTQLVDRLIPCNSCATEAINMEEDKRRLKHMAKTIQNRLFFRPKICTICA